MGWGEAWVESFRPLVDLVYPPRCPQCGDAMADQAGLCATCWELLTIPSEPWCATCQRPFPNGTTAGEMQCGACLASPPSHGGIAAATLYNDVSRQLVLRFKHGRRIAMADMLGRLMAARLPELEAPWVVVPVPLHRWRLWRRGFNQSALLAEKIAQLSGQTLCVDGLVRRKATPSLGGLGRKARQQALKGAIAANTRRASRIKGAQVILVDDVLTSGATSDACLQALHKAGAEKVLICCFARRLEQP